VTAVGFARNASVGLPSEVASSDVVVASDGMATYTAADGGVSVGVRAFDDSVQLSAVLTSAKSGNALGFAITPPAGSHMVVQTDGSVLFVEASGASASGGIAAPWAKDANGAVLATYYSLNGNTLIQHVAVSATTTYPVVADPWLFINLIDHATWHYTSPYGWTFQVYPTLWARANAGSTAVGYADWDELYARYKNAGLNTNLSGMRDQLVCHEIVVAIVQPTKASWNIDEWRPSVGLLSTINAKCNPGNPGSGTIWD
jgi:hypothetical protein